MLNIVYISSDNFLKLNPFLYHCRGAFPDAIRMATVNFPSKNEAMNAFIKKNRGYCLNNQISVRVLQ